MANLHVNLAFSADTGKAKAQIQELQTLLSKIAYTGSTTNVTGTMQDDLKKASMAAKDLQFHLNNAFNTTTGKFDLSLLDRSLKTSGTNISNLSTQLLGAGETGQQAFMKLAQSISLADQPMLRVSKRMQEFAVTMKNTVKWQLSSSMLHGFMGAIQSAYGYAQDLNKSLTDIRIVTGYSADQMAVFAEQANKAAKSLSTTTNDYTNASLIYFQQGLTDAEVAERTAVTVKMANAAGESAQIVSDQLTAVWNNFYDGSKSLEYYADVMTALGAATASSTDEISEGLSKFAAVAETVGLSYEYATAALTTITSNTRESADVVGNALKTLFARIQGLKLGETLEDGVDLNKYSEALDKAGISIFESNGELKAMDNILIELADRWDTMSNTQQVALAQTVAGVRQYTQLIALMENWDNGDTDSMMANLRTIEGAEGALDEQAEIYAQSWEAASKRVQAAAEGIYQSLLDDDFFISLSNGFANLLGGLDAFIDGAGGVKTILIGLAGVVSTVFANKIPEAFDTFKYNLEIITKGTQSAYTRIQEQMKEATNVVFKDYNVDKNSSTGFAISSANELTMARNKLALISDKMSASELQLAKVELSIIRGQQQEIISLKQKNEALQESIRLQKESIQTDEIDLKTKTAGQQSYKDMSKLNKEVYNEYLEAVDEFNANQDLDLVGSLDEQREQLGYLSIQMRGFVDLYQEAVSEINQSYGIIGKDIFNDLVGNNFSETEQKLIKLPEWFGHAFNEIKSLVDYGGFLDDAFNFDVAKQQVKALGDTIPPIIKEVTGLDKVFNNLENSLTANDFIEEFGNLQNLIQNCTIEGKDFKKVLEGLYGKTRVDKLLNDMKLLAKKEAEAAEKAEKLNQALNSFNPQHVMRVGEAMGKLSGMIGSLVSSLSSMVSSIRVLFDPDTTGWEKFIAVLTAVSVALPMLGNAAKRAAELIEFLNKAESISTIQKGLQAAASWLQAKATNIAGESSKKAAKEVDKETAALKRNTKAKLENVAADQLDGQMDFFDQMGDAVEATDDATDSISILKNAFDKLKPSFVDIGKSILNIGKSILKVVNWKVVAAGAIAAAAISITKWFLETDQRAADVANKTAQEARKKQQEAQSAYNELFSNIKNIDSGYDALKNMTKGTDEWTQAVMELNAQVMSLIDLYPALAGAIRMVNGALVIDKQSDVYKDFIEQQLLILNSANIKAYDAQINSNQANLKSQKTDLRRDISTWGEIKTDEGITPIYQTLSKSQFDQLLKGVISGSINLNNRQSISEGLDFDKSPINYDNLVSAIQEASSAIYNLAASQANLTASNDALSAQIGSNALMTNEDYQKSENQSLIDAAVGKAYGEQNFDNWLYKRNSDTNMWDEYARIKGYDPQYSRYNPFTSQTTYKDKDGNVLDKVSNIDILKTVNIDDWANNGAVNIMKQVEQLMAQITDDSLKRILEAAVTGSIEGLTKADYDFEGEVESIFSSEVIALLESIFGEGILDNIQSYIDMTIKDSQFDLDTWKKSYSEKMAAIGEIDEYGKIDPDDYAALSAEYSEYFDVQNDGTARLKMTAEEFKAIVEGIELNKLKESIADAQGTRENAENILAEKSGGILTKAETIDTSAQSYLNSIDSGEMTENWASGLLQGDIAQAIKEALNINLEDFGTGAIEQLQGLSQAWIDLADNLDNRQDTFASTANSLDELRNQFNDGTIDIEEYNDAIDATVAKEAELEDIDYKEVLDYAKYLSENADKLEDVDDALQGNLKESKKVAMAHAKLNKAVKTLSDNWEDWNKAIKKGNLGQISDYLPEINEALKDMLDLTDENFANLSSDFAIKNWDTIKDVVNGVKGSLEKLQVAAAKDVMINLGINEDKITAEMNQAMLDLANIAEGTVLEVDTNIDTTNALEGLINLLAQVGVTGDQIQAIFDHLGWDPEITYEETDWTTAGQFSAAGYQQYAVMNPDGSYTVKSVPLTGEQDISEGGKLFIPHIKGRKKTGGSGSYTPQKTSNGGGGGGSAKEPKYAEKKSSSDKTRYHTLQNQLEDLTAEYDALADASDRAFGQDKLDAIDAEIKKTDELIDKQEEYLQAIQSDLPVDKSVMTAYYNDTIGGPAMQFDENGNISNYDQIQDAMFNKYNAMTAYDEESLEWQTFEKKYEQLEKYIEQYEETYDLLREEEANYQDLLNQRIDLELEKVEYKVEIQLEVPENQKEVIEYQLGRIEDDAKKTGETLALLTEQAEMTYDQILINKQGLNDALELSLSAAEITEVMAGNMNVLNGKTFTEDQISAIQDYKDNLLELNEEFDDIRESIEETVLEAFDMWYEKLEEGIEKFDYFGTILESYQSIIDTVGKDTLGISDNLMNTLSQASVDNAINGVEATRDAYKALQQAQIDAERELEKAKARGDEQSISFWESTLNEIQQNAEDAHEEMLSSWEEALSKIVEQFEASVQTAVDAFNEAVYQLGGIEALSEEFDRQKEMADMYLDDYQKIYELSKLNRDVNNSIDDTDSLAGKQKLKKLLGEINKLQADGVKMSEYDLEYLQAEYDLRLAEIALEEAQRAKDVVRLSRDNEGNWSYVYTQNTEAVDEAQQKYEDALYAMQDLSSNYIDEISAQLIETSQEMQEALAAIRIEDYASIEEYYEEVERVQEQYQEQLALQEEELNKAVANNKELYDTDWTNYHNAVGYKISDTEEFATKFSDTLLGTLMNSKSDTSNFTNILADATSVLMNELYGAAEQYYTNMAAAMEAAGTTTGTFADDLATNVDQIKQDSEEAATAVEDMATHMQEQMDNIINKVGEWQRTYGEAMNEIINANLAVIDSFNEMLATLSMDDSTVTVKYDIQNHNSDVLDAERFATGGYTGSWGNTGRLGILDEKELILNKDDTENFIEALKISRSMLNTIELNARQASLGLGTLIPTTVKDDIKETLEQVVQITAEFPNATDHNEIEEAFNMLINRASQFANRK